MANASSGHALKHLSSDHAMLGAGGGYHISGTVANFNFSFFSFSVYSKIESLKMTKPSVDNLIYIDDYIDSKI